MSGTKFVLVMLAFFLGPPLLGLICLVCHLRWQIPFFSFLSAVRAGTGIVFSFLLSAVMISFILFLILPANQAFTVWYAVGGAIWLILACLGLGRFRTETGKVLTVCSFLWALVLSAPLIIYDYDGWKDEALPMMAGIGASGLGLLALVMKIARAVETRKQARIDSVVRELDAQDHFPFS